MKKVLILSIILLMITSLASAQFLNSDGTTFQKTFTDKVVLGAQSGSAHLAIKSTSGEPVFQFTGYPNQAIYGFMETSTGLRILNWYGTKFLPMISTYDLGDPTHLFRYGYFTSVNLGTINVTSSSGKLSADSASLKRLLISDTIQGIVLKNRSGVKYRLRVSPTGVLTAIAVP